MKSNAASILLVEDDNQIRRFLKVGLESSGYAYREVALGKEGLAEVAKRGPELVILDLGLPDMDGQEFLRELREWSQVPVIVLTARDREQDKIQALDCGADDYLTKPFGIGELLARVRVALRRGHRIEGDSAVLENGGLRIDPIKRVVAVDGKEVRLTPTEYRILLFLAKHADRVVTQHQLLKEIWGPKASEQGNQLRVHMHQLRHKLEKDPTRPKWLVNEPGVGYRFKME